MLIREEIKGNTALSVCNLQIAWPPKPRCTARANSELGIVLQSRWPPSGNEVATITQGLSGITVGLTAQRTRTTVHAARFPRWIAEHWLRLGNRVEETRLGVDNRSGLGNDRVRVPFRFESRSVSRVKSTGRRAPTVAHPPELSRTVCDLRAGWR